QNFKNLILDARFEGYREEAGVDTHVIKEVKRLRRIGKKIDHLPGFSKDEADGLAGSVFNALELGGEEDDSDMYEMTEGLSDYDSMMITASPLSNEFGLFGSGTGPQSNPFSDSG